MNSKATKATARSFSTVTFIVASGTSIPSMLHVAVNSVAAGTLDASTTATTAGEIVVNDSTLSTGSPVLSETAEVHVKPTICIGSSRVGPAPLLPSPSSWGSGDAL